MTVPSVAPPVGTTWLYEYGDDGTFEAPVTGTYKIEMHGGGGGAAYCVKTSDSSKKGLAGGGGSGEIYTQVLEKGSSHAITIGAGGTAGTDPNRHNSAQGSDGGTTTFGGLSIAGGGGAYVQTSSAIDPRAGAASGSIASTDSGYSGVSNCPGGQGNINEPSQTYGDGGNVVNNVPNAGQHGAVIITFMGVA